jgi:DNA polymerase III delta subunit
MLFYKGRKIFPQRYIMNESALKAKLKESKNGFFIFYGDNEYLKDYYASILRKDVKDDGFNYLRYENDEFSFRDIEDFLSTYSFMNERKMLEVSDPKILKWSDKELSELSEHSDFLFYFNHERKFAVGVRNQVFIQWPCAP